MRKSRLASCIFVLMLLFGACMPKQVKLVDSSTVLGDHPKTGLILVSEAKVDAWSAYSLSEPGEAWDGGYRVWRRPFPGKVREAVGEDLKLWLGQHFEMSSNAPVSIEIQIIQADFLYDYSSMGSSMISAVEPVIGLGLLLVDATQKVHYVLTLDLRVLVHRSGTAFVEKRICVKDRREVPVLKVTNSAIVKVYGEMSQAGRCELIRQLEKQVIEQWNEGRLGGLF